MQSWIHNALSIINTLLLLINLILLLIILANLDKQGLNPKKKGGGLAKKDYWRRAWYSPPEEPRLSGA